MLKGDQEIFVFPTALILQACYWPKKLAAFLESDRDRQSLCDLECTFDGFQFTSYGGRHYSLRAARNLERAEQEAREIVPRALAYYRLHKSFAPLLIRPPFTGRTMVKGRAVVSEAGGTKIVLFTESLVFASRIGEEIARSRFERRDDLLYAPHLYACSGLTNAGGTTYYKRRKVRPEELFDIHLFKRIESAFRREISGEYGHATVSNFGAAMDLRNYCAKRIGSFRYVPYPESCGLEYRRHHASQDTAF